MGTQKVFAFIATRELIRSVYPASWRTCCRRVVEDYIRLQKENFGESIGSTKLVKAMLEPHKLPGNDRANKRLETMLTRQDIEAWLMRGVEFSDMKFNFVDCYVQTLLKSDLGHLLRANLEEYRINGISEGLAAVYMARKVTPLRLEMGREILGRCFSIIYGGGKDKQLRLIRFISEYQRVFFARIISTGSEITNVEETVRNCRIFTGYFVLTEVNGHDNEEVTGMGGVLAIQDPLFYNLQSPKTSFDSLGLVGLFYGRKEGKLSIDRSTVIEDFLGDDTKAVDDRNWIDFTPIAVPIIDDVFARLRGAVL